MKTVRVIIKISLHYKDLNNKLFNVTKSFKSLRLKINGTSISSLIKQEISNAFNSCYNATSGIPTVKIFHEQKYALLTFKHPLYRNNENLNNIDKNELYNINWWTCGTGQMNDVLLINHNLESLYLRLRTVSVE